MLIDKNLVDCCRVLNSIADQAARYENNMVSEDTLTIWMTEHTCHSIYRKFAYKQGEMHLGRYTGGEKPKIRGISVKFSYSMPDNVAYILETAEIISNSEKWQTHDWVGNKAACDCHACETLIKETNDET